MIEARGVLVSPDIKLDDVSVIVTFDPPIERGNRSRLEVASVDHWATMLLVFGDLMHYVVDQSYWSEDGSSWTVFMQFDPGADVQKDLSELRDFFQQATGCHVRIEAMTYSK